MISKLTQKQVLELKEYRLSLHTDMSKYVNTRDFIDDDKMAAFLDRASKELDSPSAKVTSSIFMKRYAFLAVISFYAFSALDKKVDVSFENIWLEKGTDDNDWLPEFYFSSIETVEANVGNRHLIRSELIKSVFADHVHPIMKLLNEMSGVSEVILWENIAVYLFWLYEKVLTEEKFSMRKTTIEEDFHFLFHDAEGFLFGEYEENPLTKYHDQKVFAEDLGEEIRVRKSCCFAYKLKGGSKRCKTCPCRLMKENCLSEAAYCGPSAIEEYHALAFPQGKGT